jgi:hypothetical protein
MPILGIIASSFRSAAGPVGAYDALATVTLSATAASITFAGIPTGYKHLQLRGIGRSTDGSTNDVTGRLQFNADTAANYSTHRLYGYGSSAGADASANASQISFATILADGNTASCFSASICDILDYENVNKFKTTRSLAGGDANNLGMMFMTSGNWRSTSAVTSITIFPSSGSWTANTTYALYGAK